MSLPTLSILQWMITVFVEDTLLKQTASFHDFLLSQRTRNAHNLFDQNQIVCQHAFNCLCHFDPFQNLGSFLTSILFVFPEYYVICDHTFFFVTCALHLYFHTLQLSRRAGLSRASVAFGP